MNKRQQNKIKTPGYFIKRLRDNGYYVNRVFQGFKDSDPRRWVVLVNPGEHSVFITCYENKLYPGDISFEFSDGGVTFPKNFVIKTESIEIVVEQLFRKNISPIANKSKNTCTSNMLPLTGQL